MHKAKAEGWRSRAAYKLISLDDKYQFLSSARVVIDLGASPGSWCEVVLQRTKAEAKILAFDLLPMSPMQGVTFFQGDFLSEEAASWLAAHMRNEQTAVRRSRCADVILSDMAPTCTGHQATDHLRAMVLADAAFEAAFQYLAPGGSFVVKLFQGKETPDFVKQLRTCFESVSTVKPQASRKDSVEFFVLARNFRKSLENGDPIYRKDR